MSTFGPDGELDPQQGIIATFIGKKRSGKSVMALWFFMNYPGDRLVIDVAGDDGPYGPDVITLEGTVETLPRKWPRYLRRYNDNGHPLPMTLRYVPDAGSATFLEDIDCVVGMAIEHDGMSKGRPGCAILIHEAGVVAEVHKTKRNIRRLLMHNRHKTGPKTGGPKTVLLCMPRTKTVDTLCTQQADLVYVFELMGAEDRKRIAENIGWNVQEFHDAVEDLGPHEYLLFDSNMDKPETDEHPDFRLIHVEAMPVEQVQRVEAWAHGKRR